MWCLEIFWNIFRIFLNTCPSYSSRTLYQLSYATYEYFFFAGKPRCRTPWIQIVLLASSLNSESSLSLLFWLGNLYAELTSSAELLTRLLEKAIISYMDDHFLPNKNGYFNILKQTLFKELIAIFKDKIYLIKAKNI